jgi:hypothetical protein
MCDDSDCYAREGTAGPSAARPLLGGQQGREERRGARFQVHITRGTLTRHQPGLYFVTALSKMAPRYVYLYVLLGVNCVTQPETGLIFFRGPQLDQEPPAK